MASLEKELKREQVLVDVAQKLSTFIETSNYVGIMKSLKEIEKLREKNFLRNLKNPWKILEILINCLSESKNQWLQKEIVKKVLIEIRFLSFEVYSLYNSEKVHVAVETSSKKAILKKLKGIEKRASGREKSTEIGESEILLECSIITEVLKFVDVDEGFYEKAKIVFLDTLKASSVVGIAMKVGYHILKTTYDSLKDRMDKELSWIEIVIYMELLKREAIFGDEKCLFELQKVLNEKQKSSWEILYFGVDALREIIEESREADIFSKALVEEHKLGNKKYQGLLSYLRFDRYVFKNNWRIQVKAVQSLFEISVHPNEKIRKLAVKQLALLQTKSSKLGKKVAKVFEDETSKNLLDWKELLKKEWRDGDESPEEQKTMGSLLKLVSKGLDGEFGKMKVEMEDFLSEKLGEEKKKLDGIEVLLKEMNMRNPISYNSQAHIESEEKMGAYLNELELILKKENSTLERNQSEVEELRKNVLAIHKLLQENQNKNANEICMLFKKEMFSLRTELPFSLKESLLSILEEKNDKAELVKALKSELLRSRKELSQEFSKIEELIFNMNDKLSQLEEKSLSNMKNVFEELKGNLSESVKNAEEVMEKLKSMEKRIEDAPILNTAEMKMADLKSKVNQG